MKSSNLGRFTCIFALGLCAAQPAIAQKQRPPAQGQLSEADAAALAHYAMPLAFAGVQAECQAHLPRSAYIYTGGDALAARLEAASAGSWPRARNAIFLIGGSNRDAEMAEVIANMPEEAISPFVSEMIRSLVAQEMDAEVCVKVDRVLEMLDPLPPENLANLFGFIMIEAGFNERGR